MEGTSGGGPGSGVEAMTAEQRLGVAMQVLRTLLTSMIKEKQRFRERFKVSCGFTLI